MPEHIKALIVILAIATVVFYFVGKNQLLVQSQLNYPYRKILWFLLTITAFLAHSFWLYAIVTVSLVFLGRVKEPNPPALFYFLVFLLPAASTQIPGFGVINFLINIDHIRLLILCILLPAWARLRFKSNVLPFGKTAPDKLLAAYLVLIAVLMVMRIPSFTAAIRGITGLFIDIYLPYYVFSRVISEFRQVKDVISSYVIVASMMGVVALFEILKHWQLYTNVTTVLGLVWGYAGYSPREGLLRSIVTTGQPIALGFVMTVAVGFYLVYLSHGVKHRHSVGGALLAGVITPLSKGPWVGLAVTVLAFIGTGNNVLKNMAKLFIATLLGFSLLAVSPAGDKVFKIMGFLVGKSDVNVDYRKQLIDNSMIVIQRNPLFGSKDFLETSEMEEMRQGEGIIDVTNTYLAIALNYGLVGLGLFTMFFVSIIFSLYRTLKRGSREEETVLIGRSLLSVMLGMMTILTTVSSITIIPTVYWSVAGLCVAYISIAKKKVSI